MKKDYEHLLSGFLDTVPDDPRISTTACCLYLLLLAEMKKEKSEGDVVINRKRVQLCAKISRTTFQKAIHELQALGYIRYISSCNPLLGSIVQFCGFPDLLLNISIERDDILFDTIG